MFVFLILFSLIRNPDRTSNEFLTYDKPEVKYSQDQFVACPVKKGSLVLIHGLVVHQSDWNRSNKSRFAYTFHVMESENVKYSPENWLQLPEGESFPELWTKFAKNSQYKRRRITWTVTASQLLTTVCCCYSTVFFPFIIVLFSFFN